MAFRLRPRRRPPAGKPADQPWLLATHPVEPGPVRPPLDVPDIRMSLDGTLPQAPHRAALVPELKPLLTRKHVAIVDDEPLVLDLLAEILKTENVTVTAALSGAELLERIEHIEGPDLLITDYMMPGMHGRELARRVRARVPHVRVLYQTGYVDQLFDSSVELEPGAAFIEKPITARGLREAARLALFDALNP